MLLNNSSQIFGQTTSRRIDTIERMAISPNSRTIDSATNKNLHNNAYDDTDVSTLHKVVFSYYDIRCDNGSVHLEWGTRLETNNETFKIEKSTDMKIWEYSGSVPGNGTSDSLQIYRFIDKNSFHGISYYRLLSCDYNGNCEEYEPVVINCFDNDSMILVNIVKSKLIIKNLKSSASVRIFNTQGSLVYFGVAKPDLCELELFDIPTGIYFIVVSSNRILLNKSFFIQ